jgi:Arc/MetJ-type ribon-helix-helix transcriptional regulator
MPNVTPLKYSISFAMRVDQEFLDAVEELRGLQRPIPTKSDVIREAVMEALKRAKAKGKR